MVGLSDIGSMAQSLQASIDAAMKRVQDQAKNTKDDKPAGKVQQYEQNVRKSALNTAPMATNIGTLVKDTSRLNVFSSLAANDPADFYKFTVTTKGEVALGRVGDADVRIQLMDKQGKVVADSNKDAGATYDAYKKLEKGELTVDRGDYTVRIARDKDVPVKDPKNYGVQLKMGTYSKDYDTIAKQPAKGDNPFQNSPQLQRLSALLGTSSSSSSGALNLLNGGGGRGSLLNGLF
ncbi:hypothetical protein [Azospirillum sp. sgz302134]